MGGDLQRECERGQSHGLEYFRYNRLRHPARGYLDRAGRIRRYHRHLDYATLWNIPQNVQVASLGNPIGDGLGNGGDRVILKNAAGAIVDAVSWGTNTSAFNPSVPVVPYGHSMARATTSPDTNTAREWFGSNTPVPGK